MRTLIVGGTGHIGGYLTQQLVEEGHEVVIVSSGRTPFETERFGGRVEVATLDYMRTLCDGSFRALILDKKPDAVVDILQGDAHGVHTACSGTSVNHIVFCGSVWMFGRPKVVPTPEVTQTPCPFEGYQKRYNEMQEVIGMSDAGAIAVSAVMPPNICGPGKVPLDGMGGRSVEVHRAHRDGKEVCLPHPGTNLIGPCDADDVARGFACALRRRDTAAGEMFNVGSAYALTSEQFVRAYADIYGVAIPIRYVDPWEFEHSVMPDTGANFHFLEHMCPDISKISSRLGYRPHYTPQATMERAVRWMREQGLL